MLQFLQNVGLIMKIESVAAIDVGSNTVRLLVSNVEDYGERQVIKKNAYLRVPVRLGEDVFSSGAVGPEKFKKLLDTMDAFQRLMGLYQVSRYRVCATSALREATNKQAVVEAILKHCGLVVEVISGPEEADIIFAAGNLASVLKGDNNYLHVDVGGGSTEIVIYHQQEKREHLSFPVGTLRLLAGQVTPEVWADFEAQLAYISKKYYPLDVVASGGNINKTLKILGKQDGDVVEFAQLESFRESLLGLSMEEKLARYELNSYRADVIGPALSVFTAVGRICQASGCVIPKVGLVDGIIHLIHQGRSPHQGEVLS